MFTSMKLLYRMGQQVGPLSLTTHFLQKVSTNMHNFWYTSTVFCSEHIYELYLNNFVIQVVPHTATTNYKFEE